MGTYIVNTPGIILASHLSFIRLQVKHFIEYITPIFLIFYWSLKLNVNKSSNYPVILKVNQLFSVFESNLI
jgi:hypothetical protein